MSTTTFTNSSSKTYQFGNSWGIEPSLFKSIVQISNKITNENITPILPTGVSLTDGANISVDASLGTDFYVTLGGNRTILTPTNQSDWKTIKLWITQDGKGSRTATWDSGFRFSTGLPSPTLTTTIDFTDLIEFEYNPTYSSWDCIRIVKGFDSTPV